MKPFYKRSHHLICLILMLSNQAFAQTFKTFKKLPDTGQNTSYTNTFGEDNDYQLNVPGFINLSANRVLDTVSSMVWQRTDAGEMTFENAINYCDTLTLDQFTDWKLPLAAELFSIQNSQNNNPALNTSYFTKTAAEYWWSSERQSNDASRVWCTNAGGGIGNHPKVETVSAGGVKKFHTRCMRTDFQPIFVKNRFFSVGDSSVVDSLTMLQWQIFPPNTTKTWEDALVYAEGLFLDDHSDWRLPNIKELRSLNDEKRVSPSVQNTFSFGVRKIWSSTSLPNQTTKAWYFETNYGITTYDLKTNSQYLLCVRNFSENVSGTAKYTKTSKIVNRNPIDNNLEITIIEPSEIFIVNQLGQIAYQGKADYLGVQSIDVSSIPNGIFTVILKSAHNQLSEKIIKYNQ